MNIGEAAAAAGVTPKMIRHYESLGMIPDVQRTGSGYRVYSAREVAMLRFIRQARTLGFPVKQVEDLLALWRNEHRASREVKQIAQEQLRELEARQREIDEMRATLSHLVGLCKGDDAPRCAILDTLSAPVKATETGRDSRKNLKEVRAGSGGMSPGKYRDAKAVASGSGHAALSAWSRTLGR